MFGQFTPKYSYTSDGTYDNPMTLSAVIEFDGEEQINPNLELGVFCGDELRGGAFVIERKGRYYARPLIYGQSGQFFTFKVYDHTTGIEREWSVGSTFTYGGSTMEYMSYNSNGYGNFSQPAVIDFVTPNYWNPEPFQFNFQVTAVILKDGVEQTDTNLELGAFSVSDGTVRGSVKLYPQTILGNTRYYAYMLVGGTSGEEITFKLYDHGTRQELQFNDVNTCILTEDDDATGNPILGSYIKPFEVNFITAPYVAQIGENKYLSFDAALEAAEDGDNIELLKSIDLGTTTTVISKDINITLGEYAITGTVELANISATITGAQDGVTSVTTNVEGYKVVYEGGMYKLVKKLSGEIAYRAYVGDESNRESVKVDLKNIYASESVVVKLYDANNNLLTTTSYKAGGVEAPEYLTCNIVLSGNPSSSWETVINVEKLTVDNYPKKAELLIDGTCIHTFDNILGNATDAAAYQLPAYLALDCVYKEASITRNGTTEYYMTLEAAIAAAQSGDEVVLHNDVLVSGKQTITTAITINGNNHSIKADETAVWYTTGNPPHNLKQYKTHLLGLNSDNITLKNIVLDCNDNAAGINLYCAQNVTFDNVQIINATRGFAALTVNGSTLTVKTNFVALGNPVAIDIDLGSGVTSALGFDVEDNTVFDLGGKQVKYDPAATIDMDGAVDTNGNPYFAAKDNVYYYTVAQMESRTNAYSNGLTLLTDVAINSDIRFSGNTLDLNEKTLSISAEKQMEVSGEFKITNGGAINGKIVLTTQETTITTTLNELNVIKKEGLDGEVVYVEGKYMLAPYVAKINDVYYISLQAAYEAVQPTGVIVLLQNITLSETLTIAAEKNFTLDLNGKTINVGYQENSEDKHIYAFENKGTLTITDNSAEANGVINARGNYNYGTLTLVNGTINAIDHNGGYGIQNLEGSTFTMNGGLIATTNENGDAPGDGYDATTVRVESGAVFVMNGGEINNISNYTFAIDNYGTTTIKENAGEVKSVHTAVANYGTMTISAGTFICNGLEGVTAHALWADAGTTTINGGTFDGKDNYNGFNVCASEGATVYITGGNFLPVHSGSLYGEGTIAVSGGTFFDAVPEARCAEGYIPTTNADGTYGVKPGSYVAQVGEVKYETLQAAINAATEGCTIALLADVEVSYPLLFSFNSAFDKINVTFNGNGKTIKAVGTAWDDNTWLADIAWNVTLNNVTFDGNNTGCKGVQFYTSESTLNNITVKNISADKWGITDYAIHANASELTVIGSLTFEGCKHGMFMVDLGNNTGKEASVVSIDNNATVNGVKVILNHKDASLEAPASAADYVSMGNVPGYTMVYENGVYKLVAIEVQTITLEERWNWVSHYVVGNTDSDILTQLQNGLGTYGVQIKNQFNFTNYNTEEQSWSGSLSATSVTDMYKVNTSLAIDQTLQVELSGVLVDPAQYPITLDVNWNYIGYPLNEGVSVGTVFANVAKDGDYVKSQDAFAEYYDGTWHGNLKTMKPGEGYMYRNIPVENVDVTKTLVYSYPNAKEATEANITSENNYWVPVSSQYADNMTMVAMLDVKGGDYEVAAFVGGEVRGSSRPVYIESLDAYMFFLTIHGDEVAEMTFKVYDLATGEEYSIDNRMNYSDDAVVGSVRNPYMLTCSTLAVGENNISNISIYPNPTTTGNEINLGTECDTVEVFNALGVKVAEYQNVDTVDALETAGIYVIRITNDGNVQNCRLIVK